MSKDANFVIKGIPVNIIGLLSGLLNKKKRVEKQSSDFTRLRQLWVEHYTQWEYKGEE